MPATTFHWIRIQTFCYATERKNLLEEVMKELLGDAEYFEELMDSEYGNTITIFKARLTRQRQYRDLFLHLGPEIVGWISEDLGNRVDEDCMFYIRLDKQKAVQGVYEIAHHGDVIAVTGKVQSHPARKEVAERVLGEFLRSLFQSPGSSDRDS